MPEYRFSNNTPVLRPLLHVAFDILLQKCYMYRQIFKYQIHYHVVNVGYLTTNVCQQKEVPHLQRHYNVT